MLEKDNPRRKTSSFLRGKYLQIAFNRQLPEVREMISMLPPSERILIEAGTPLIKNYGTKGISSLKEWWISRIFITHLGNVRSEKKLKILKDSCYIIADLKCMDRGSREVEIAARAGASAATCLGLAPIATIDEFIKNCQNAGIDSMIDMMNVPFPFEILQKLKRLPTVVVLHRGADENEKGEKKQIPFQQIHQIKGTYNILISVAGGESFREVRRAFFNDSDIAVVWRSFYENPEKTAELAREFLKEIR